MSTIIIALSDILLDPKQPVDLSSLPTDEASRLIRDSYGFLSAAVEVQIDNGVATITLPEAKSREVEEALEWFDRGIKKARRGDYEGAKKLLAKTLEYLPAHTDARRNLAMAHLETGNYDEALDHLIDVLRLDPKDVWGYILLGNTYAKYQGDFVTAEPFYKKAYALNPNDPYLLNNYAALKVHNGQFDHAEQMFHQAIQADASYPHSYLGLAILHSNRTKNIEAIEPLRQLFTKASADDPRSKPVFEQARVLYATLNRQTAEENHDVLMTFIESRAKAVEAITGFAVEITEDNSLTGVTAKSLIAWKHHTNQHRILHKTASPVIVPHLIAHELEHILLEHEARSANVNQQFVVRGSHREYAQNLIRDDVQKLLKEEFSPEQLTETENSWINGLTNQLYNCPLDMVIEKRLYDKYEVLRPAQFVSLEKTQLEYLTILTDPDLRRISPHLIYRASLAMNCAYAIFTDWLYDGATEYSLPYKSSAVYSIGEKLFDVFLSQQASKMIPSEEYDLIKQFARILRLEGWFSLESDSSQADTSPEGPTNIGLLKQKEAATVMYCLDALKRFQSMSKERIQEIAFEVGMLGTAGIDYSKPDRRYSLKALPGEQFTGLQLLVFMFVGFKKIDPALNSGLDFDEAYRTAMTLMEGGG